MIYKGLILISLPILFLNSFLVGKNGFLVVLFFMSVFIALPIGLIMISIGFIEQKYYIRNIFFSILGGIISMGVILGNITKGENGCRWYESICAFGNIDKLFKYLNNYWLYIVFIFIVVVFYVILTFFEYNKKAIKKN